MGIQYVKVRRETADYLGLRDARPRFADGNYLLWDRDFLKLGSSDDFGSVIPAAGGVVLSAQQVRAEQDGGEPVELPEITDVRILEYTGMKPDGEHGERPEEDEEGGER